MSDGTRSPHGGLRVTRVTNACVLIQLGPHSILTDPWFKNPWGFNEDPGLQVSELPSLTAILGSHWAGDHWDIGCLREHPSRASTRVYTSTEGMARKAQQCGFDQAQCLQWGETRHIAPDLTIEVMRAQRIFGSRSNNYVLNYNNIRVFFGGEAKELEPLKQYGASNPPVDVVLAPVNGMRLLGVMRLVMNAQEALEGAKALGAKVLIPIHDSMHDMGLGGPTSSGAELRQYTQQRKHQQQSDPAILFLPAGEATEIVMPRVQSRTAKRKTA